MRAQCSPAFWQAITVVDVKVTLYDGSYHEVDSSEMAFKIAGSMAFKDAMKKAAPVLMEPIMKVAIIVPDEYLGDVIGDVNSRRGHDSTASRLAYGAVQINAFIPLCEHVRLRYRTSFQDTGTRSVCQWNPATIRRGSEVYCGRLLFRAVKR